MWEPIEPGRENRAEIAALKGLALSALATLALVLAVLASGCAGDRDGHSALAASCSTPQPAMAGMSARPPGRYVTSPRGVRVWAPAFLDGSLLREALDEIDSTQPEADPRLSGVSPGVPVGVEVTIMDPGAFSTPASPTGVARGQTDMGSVIVVSWRMAPYEDRPLMPALGHELRHYATKDPQAGH